MAAKSRDVTLYMYWEEILKLSGSNEDEENDLQSNIREKRLYARGFYQAEGLSAFTSGSSSHKIVEVVENSKWVARCD